MPASRLPFVGDTTSLGEAARAATEAKVGAVIVARTEGLWILPIGVLPNLAEGTVGDFVSTFAKRVGAPGNFPRRDFTLNSIDGGLAEIEFDIHQPWRINVVYGFKECDVNPRHTYPPTYGGTFCTQPCPGNLVLRP